MSASLRPKVGCSSFEIGCMIAMGAVLPPTAGLNGALLARGRRKGSAALRFQTKVLRCRGISPRLYRLKGSYLRFAEHWRRIVVAWLLLLTPCSNLFQVRCLLLRTFFVELSRRLGTAKQLVGNRRQDTRATTG